MTFFGSVVSLVNTKCNFVSENHCDLVTCHNGGTCIRVPAGVWCDCSPGYTGQHCEQGQLYDTTRMALQTAQSFVVRSRAVALLLHHVDRRSIIFLQASH